MKTRGFTLIELLVVIAIIGILSSVVLVSLNSARAKSRDARRLADLKQLETALAIYHNDNRAYPTTNGGWRGNCSTYGGYSDTGAGGWVPNLAPTYIPVLPLNPKSVPPGGCYLYRSDGIDYMLLAHQTVESYTALTNPAKRPLIPASNSFAFYTSGAANW